jgi:hypothetical protein
VVESLIEWLRKPENDELVKAHNLLKALERRGLVTQVYQEL